MAHLMVVQKDPQMAECLAHLKAVQTVQKWVDHSVVPLAVHWALRWVVHLARCWVDQTAHHLVVHWALHLVDHLALHLVAHLARNWVDCLAHQMAHQSAAH